MLSPCCNAFAAFALYIFPLASRILDGDKYYPFFEDCFEALNPIHAPSPEQA
jgi:hypothetical protein